MKKLFFWNKYTFVLTLVIFLFIFFAPQVQASSLEDDIAVQLKTGAEAAELQAVVPQVIITDIINAVLTLIGVLFILLAIYAGYLRFTANGAEEEIKKSNEVLIAAIIGSVIVFMAYAITRFVTTRAQNAAVLEEVYDTSDYHPNAGVEAGIIIQIN